jgi:hypothetical protein
LGYLRVTRHLPRVAQGTARPKQRSGGQDTKAKEKGSSGDRALVCPSVSFWIVEHCLFTHKNLLCAPAGCATMASPTFPMAESSPSGIGLSRENEHSHAPMIKPEEIVSLHLHPQFQPLSFALAYLLRNMIGQTQTDTHKHDREKADVLG